MAIDPSTFTPGPALAGGLLIGAAVALLALFDGRIAGISGIAAGLLRPRPGEWLWRAFFIGGLVVAPLAYRCFAGFPVVRIDAPLAQLLLAGVLVGIGTRQGSGCTSGHGVCGVARASPRSIAATAAFVGAGMVTVFVLRHLVRP
jgi:uncharacterized membrane protein YedE/YeeE